MALPNITANFLRTTTPENPQDFTAYAHVVGPSCMGPLNTPTRLDQLSDCTQFGTGPGIELAASTLLLAGGPVYFTRSLTSTPSVTSSVTKTFANPTGTPVIAYGSVLVNGATDAGDVLVTGKDTGVSLTVVNPGVVTAATLVNVVGKAITVTLKHDGTNITETGTGLAAAINGSVAAFALVGATPYLGGAGIAGPLTNTNLDTGALSFTALQSGVSFTITLSGISTVFATAYNAMTKTITVTLGTDANGEPTTTAGVAGASLAALALANPGVFTAGLVTPPGAGLLGAKVNTLLPFGSNGTMVVTGTACDAYDVRVQIVQGGTVGGLTPILAIWSVDGGANYTSRSIGIVSPTGVLLLKDSLLDTMLTVTFTGTVDTGDVFSFTTTLPVTSPTDLIAGVDAAIAETTFRWGYVTSPVSVNKALATLLDNRLQAAFQDKFIYGIFNTRDIAEGVPGETEDQWISAITNDFAGFNSTNGLLDMSAGHLLWLSPYTQRQFTRPNVFFINARNATIPVHEDLGKTASNTSSINNVLSIKHDEFKNPGLDEQRFITTRTYTFGPAIGRIFLTRGITMADSANIGFTKPQWKKIALGTAYNVKRVLFNYLLSSLPAIPYAESTSIPAGALSQVAANKVRSDVLTVMDRYLNRPKTDGEVSASAFDCTVPRNYNFLATKNLIVNLSITPLGVVEQITFNLSINIPA